MLKQVRLLFVFILITFASCKSTYTVNHVETNQYVFSDTANSIIDSTAFKMIRPYHDSLDKIMNEKLAFSNQALLKGTPESLLGNFAADACADQAVKFSKQLGIKIQNFTFLNNGGLRTSLPKGEITRRNIFELMPFENELVIVSLNGLQTAELLDYIAKLNGAPVSGIRLELKNKTISSCFINGESFDSTKTYRILTSDYLANGGDNLDFLKAATKEKLNLKVRDAMIYYLQGINKKGDTLNVNIDGRIREIQ